MNIEPTLKYLLTSPHPFICLIKGQWGERYFVKEFVRKNCSKISKLNFSYISLFGISSIDELVQAIFVTRSLRRRSIQLSRVLYRLHRTKLSRFGQSRPKPNIEFVFRELRRPLEVTHRVTLVIVVRFNRLGQRTFVRNFTFVFFQCSRNF